MDHIPTTTTQPFNWKIAGKAGEGVMTTASTFAYVCHRMGLKTFTYFEYPSLIKGGHQTGQVSAHPHHMSCQKKHVDVLIALDELGIKEHRSEITPETIIIAEPNIDKYDIAQYTQWTPHIYNIDMTTISREQTGSSIATNTVALGISAYFLGLDPTLFHQMITSQFTRKGEEIVQKNIAAFTAGFAKAKEFGTPIRTIAAQPQPDMLLTAGEALGSGVLAGGLQFYAAYPMSPSSNVFHYIAAQQEHFPLVVRHAEDEIAAMNLTIGAAFAGVRAMTGTAGGGFALMVEALSLTGVTELPIVALVAQRPGPATGLPTWTGQGDLQFVIRAGHGEFQKIVLTPGNAQEHFLFGKLSQTLAEKYQVPVIIMSDKYLLESYQTMPTPEATHALERHSIAQADDLKEDNSYRRYAITPSGISPRSYPGQPHGLQLTNSYEHDEFGYATEDASMTIAQVEKRARKFDHIQEELPQPYLIGPENADITCVGWGSTLSVFEQLVYEQQSHPQPTTHNPQPASPADRPSVNYLHIPCTWPFPTQTCTALAQKAKKLIMVEANHDGQMEQLIRQETGITFASHIRRYDGRPFYVEEILHHITNSVS